MADQQTQLIVSPSAARTLAKPGQQVISRPVNDKTNPPPGPPVADWQHPFANGPASIFQWGPQFNPVKAGSDLGTATRDAAVNGLTGLLKPFIPVIVLAVIVLAFLFLVKQ